MRTLGDARPSSEAAGQCCGKAKVAFRARSGCHRRERRPDVSLPQRVQHSFRSRRQTRPKIVRPALQIGNRPCRSVISGVTGGGCRVRRRYQLEPASHIQGRGHSAEVSKLAQDLRQLEENIELSVGGVAGLWRRPRSFDHHALGRKQDTRHLDTATVPDGTQHPFRCGRRCMGAVHKGRMFQLPPRFAVVLVLHASSAWSASLAWWGSIIERLGRWYRHCVWAVHTDGPKRSMTRQRAVIARRRVLSSRRKPPRSEPARLLFLSPRGLAAAIRSGRQPIDDYAVDHLMNPGARVPRASLEATPVEVAVKAAHMLTAGEPLSVLDLGAGIGKLCIVGALTTGATFTGVERSLSLVRAARSAALRFGARRVRFIHGDIAHVTLSAFDAIYLFDLRPEADDSCTALLWGRLGQVRRGTRLVTYRGGLDPPGCQLLRRELSPAGDLAAFVKL